MDLCVCWLPMLNRPYVADLRDIKPATMVSQERSQPVLSSVIFGDNDFEVFVWLSG